MRAADFAWPIAEAEAILGGTREAMRAADI